MSFFDQLKRSAAIAKKDLRIYYFRGPVIIQGLLIPAFLFLSFSFRRDVALDFLLSGLVGMALFFAVSAITPVIAPWETRMKTFERLISCPISLWAILLGDIMASMLFGLFITLFILVASVIILGAQIITLPLLAGIMAGSFCFSAFGTLISAPPADKPSDIMLISTLIKFPLIFISGVFAPLYEMGAARFLSYISPLTYYTDLVRHAMIGEAAFPPATNVLALAGFAVVLYSAAVAWHRKNLDKRF